MFRYRPPKSDRLLGSMLSVAPEFAAGSVLASGVLRALERKAGENRADKFEEYR